MKSPESLKSAGKFTETESKLVVGRGWKYEWGLIINGYEGASLVVQWLRIRLPMQGTWVQSLVQEDPTCRGATKPVHHNY